MKFFFLTLFLFVQFFALYSQATISGKVKDETGQFLAFASISLVTSQDTTMIEGNLTGLNGEYAFENVKPGSYRILASYIGYENVFSDIFELKEENKKASVDINFLNKGLVLDEAVIVSKRPFLEQKSDRLVVNVANSAIAAGGTAIEILQKVPGVVIIQDKVTLAGSQNLQVWIDGKPSNYTDMNAVLRDMPGDQIDKIELITQPGAQFDAAGGPIINIQLKRNADLGFKGTAALTLAGFRVNHDDINRPTQNYGRVNPSVNMTYRNGKINLFGNASYNNGSYFTVFDVERFIGNDIYRSQNLDNSTYIFRNIRLGADYYLSDKTTVSTVFRTWKRDGDGNSLSKTSVFENIQNTRLDDFVTENLSTSDRAGKYGSIGFKHEFDRKTGKVFTIDADYNRFDTRNINGLDIYKNNAPSLRSISKQDVEQPVDIIVVKSDYVFPIDSTWKFETGVKASFAKVNNLLNFYRNNLPSEQESNDFLYKENINAAYLNLGKTSKKFDFNFGLRVEQTIVKGKSKGIDTLDRNYTQPFPSANALYKINQHLGIQTAYSRRVNRPGFQQQNPFSYFIDSLTYTRGNPNLRPEIANNYQLNVTYDNQPFIGFSYSETDDVIVENAPKIEGTKTFTVAENLANQKRLEMQLNFPIKIGKWLDGFGGNQAIYNSYDASYLGNTYKTSRWHWLAYWQFNVALPADVKMEIGGFYLTKFLEEFLTIDKLLGVDIGISKTFAEKKGRVSLSVNDIFYSQKTNATIAFSDVNVLFKQREFSRNVRLSFSFQFGNTKLKNISNRGAASENEASRVKVD